MINTIDNLLPHEINLKIINHLLNTPNWSFPSDDFEEKKHQLNNMLYKNKKNAGFMLMTFDSTRDINLNTPLNIYAEIIFYKIQQLYNNKIKNIIRFYWNYYDNSASMIFHQDMVEKGYVSIVYNMHDNDGGTEFKDDKFIKSKEGQAILFESNLFHRGVAPKKTNHRFSLNILTTGEI